MKRQPSNVLVKNPIRRLLEAFPIMIADQKRALIQRDLEEIGEWEHYRQSIARQGKDIGKINVRALIILKTHLGVSDQFFINDQAKQDEEIQRIAIEQSHHTLFPG